jgi:AcrR family transcriptional regulator
MESAFRIPDTPGMPTIRRPASSARRLGRDAQRNRDAIVAARQVFCDHGLEAPLEQIARRAGVGIATLYRRFPSRVELLDAVLADTVQAHLDGHRCYSPAVRFGIPTAASTAQSTTPPYQRRRASRQPCWRPEDCGGARPAGR